MYYIHVHANHLVEVSTGVGERFKSLAFSNQHVLYEEGLDDFLTAKIEQYKGNFALLPKEARNKLLDNLVLDFNRGIR